MAHDATSGLSADQRATVDRLAADALLQPVAQREEYVRDQCGSDEAVLAEVKLLIEHAGRADSEAFLSAPPELPPMASDEPVPELDLKPGDVVGHYTLSEQIGEGGFAIVFLAEQTAPVARRVALKILKPGMDSREIVSRFRAEQQMLALLDHPNVANVFDSGLTPRGLPFFVMEYVAGEPITRHCNRNRMTIERRLDLFMAVCLAVQHAHQKGVIHRDIKPGNVLMSSAGTDAIPKVLDFGVAKAVSGPLSDRTVFTEQGQLIGTPEYMSPEQAAMGKLDIDTRSDVYSLGVLLFELITGVLPFDPAAIRKGGVDEIRRAIRETEPTRPSTRLETLSHRPSSNGSVPARTADDLAREHGTDTKSLIRRVRGDLDWIVLRALEKDRSRRYQTVNALVMDIRHHLANEPITARRPTTAYRMSRFVRRNRAAVFGATAAIAALSIGLGIATWQAFAANAAATRERRQSNTLREVVDFITGDFIAAGDPNLFDAGGDVSLRDAIDFAAGRVEERFEDPLVEAAIRAAIGNMYRGISEYESAEPHLKAALDVRSELLDERDPVTLFSMNDWATWLQDTGSMDAAEELFVRTLALREDVLGPNDPETIVSLNNLANLYRVLHRYDEAEPLYRDVLDRLINTVGDEHVHTATVKEGLATVYQERKEFAEAERFFREALETHIAVSGEHGLDTARARSNLAFLLRKRLLQEPDQPNQGMMDECETLYREALEVTIELLSEEHFSTYKIKDNLASFLHVIKKEYDEAGPLYESALRGLKSILEPTHFEVIRVSHNLATYYIAIEEYGKADTMYREMIDDAEIATAGFPWAMAVFKGSWGKALTHLERFEDAERLLLEGFNGLGELMPVDEWRRPLAAGRLADLYEAWGKPDEAARWRLTAEELEQREPDEQSGG